MAIIAAIQSGLDGKADTLAAGTPIVHENTNYQPVYGTSWWRTTNLTSPRDPDNWDKNQEHAGVYQIDVFVPLEDGTDDLLAALDVIYSGFAAIYSFEELGYTIHVGRVGRTQTTRDDAWYTGSIEVEYLCRDEG